MGEPLLRAECATGCFGAKAKQFEMASTGLGLRHTGERRLPITNSRVAIYHAIGIPFDMEKHGKKTDSGVCQACTGRSGRTFAMRSLGAISRFVTDPSEGISSWFTAHSCPMAKSSHGQGVENPQ